MLVSKEVKKPVKSVVSKGDKREVQGINRPDNSAHSSLFLQRYVGNSALQPPPTKVQRQAVGEPEGFEAPPIVHEVLRSPGQPLDEQTQAFMEPRFGYDFGQVRVHTDGKAAESARAVNARAYTVGWDVVFGEGQYVPGSVEGRHLLAHELAHTLQYPEPSECHRSVGEIGVSQPGDPAEREAERAADQVMTSDGNATIEPLRARSEPGKIHRAIPSPATRERMANKDKIAKYRKQIEQDKAALEIRLAVDNEDWVRSQLQQAMAACDAASVHLDAYEKGGGVTYRAGPMPIVGLSNLPSGPIILPVTAPPVVTPAAPAGASPATAAGGTGTTLLGVGAALGIAVISWLVSSSSSSTGPAPVTWTQIQKLMDQDLPNVVGTALGIADVIQAQAKKTAKPAPKTSPQPTATPDATITTTAQEQPKQCPAGQMPYSQDAAVARVVALMKAAPQRIGEAGRAKTQGSANFLATIKSNAAVISVVTPQECALASADGTHDVGDTAHAEEKALAKLASWRSSKPTVPPGTRLAVVVSASPCGSDRHNCWKQLTDFATRTPILVYNAGSGRCLLTVSGIRPR